jgi:hypothetical protein
VFENLEKNKGNLKKIKNITKIKNYNLENY